MGLFNLDRFKRKYKEVTRYINGQTFYEFGNDAMFSKFESEEARIDYVLNNVPFMLALKAKCDLFSIVKINSYSKDNNTPKEIGPKFEIYLLFLL